MIVDELGLFPPNGIDLVEGLITSMSAREGRMLAISIQGDSELVQDLIRRKDDPKVCVHLYVAPKGCELDGEDAWHASNPGLAEGIKGIRYMRDMAERAAASPGKQAAFRAFDLNQVGNPDRIMIVQLDVWETCAAEKQPPRARPCFLGVDLGGSASMTCATGYWPETGRLEAWEAFGNIPPLDQRSKADNVGDAYLVMEERGELQVYPGRVTPVMQFLRPGMNFMLEHAIKESTMHYDSNGNMCIDKSRSKRRIDSLSASVIAVGLGSRGYERTGLDAFYDVYFKQLEAQRATKAKGNAGPK
ncbi:MAG: hypothetical protein OXC41_01885 [Gammaproteobacteria bacterium]|nr:hypothetical protein [Gammaproteobacteria bacterium]